MAQQGPKHTAAAPLSPGSGKDMTANKPYHEGELAVQARAGASHAAQMSSGILSDRIPGGGIPFISQQTMAVLGSRDAPGNVWASLLFGKAGFLHAETDRRLVLRHAITHGARGDPLWDNLETDPRLGILLIELTSRRRLRINGSAHRLPDGDWRIDVERAYANCPKYIQARRLRIPDVTPLPAQANFRQGGQLDAAQQAWIASADTFFVASAHPEQGLDASHRGGRPGFVKVLNPHRLRIPDFVGNNMFNTLGNFASYPHAGLVFPDFERGRILQLSGRPELRWDLTDTSGETGGTARYWEFELQTWHESVLPLRLEWQFIDYSPFIPVPENTGEETQASLSLRVKKTWHETDRIKGFELAAADGSLLPPFEPGAHLPVKVRDRSGAWVERHYSLLSNPADRQHYRIGVLMEPNGRGGSLYLHNTLKTGDSLQAGPPANAFPLETGATHSILLAGGIGITPLLSMAHTLKAHGKSFELHYSARRFADLAFRQDIVHLAGHRAHFYASREPGAPRLDLQFLLGRPTHGTHVYICGPRAMIVTVRELAETIGWPPEQIHFESFGAAASPDDRALTVILARSGRSISVPAGRGILDVLLEAGVAVPYDCRRGECSLCMTRFLAGEPEHRDLCLSAEERSELMCVCVSRAHSKNLTLDL
jgi:ferredoxin-NADP reductase/predicted pyridoxine 5'-phosphate oxidase superfamily flavin-nucleotide-binding protein